MRIRIQIQHFITESYVGLLIGRHRIYTDSHTHDHLHDVKYSTYMRSALWANQNIHLLYDLLAQGSMTVKITFTRYEKYVHITEVPPRFHPG
jgi:hypothetical protein